MNLRLVREPSVNGCTFGVLFLEGHYAAFTLEDEIRPAGVKVPGATCIPAGSYRILLTMSPHFQALLPELIGVPQFEGIRIHAGNVIADTAGCILVGKDRNAATLLQSRVALEALLSQLAKAETPIWITIENQAESKAA